MTATFCSTIGIEAGNTLSESVACRFSGRRKTTVNAAKLHQYLKVRGEFLPHDDRQSDRDSGGSGRVLHDVRDMVEGGGTVEEMTERNAYFLLRVLSRV